LHKSLSELDGVHNIINWIEIEKALSNFYSSVRGVPIYPPLIMFKIIKKLKIKWEIINFSKVSIRVN
jgi:hypothetical protein